MNGPTNGEVLALAELLAELEQHKRLDVATTLLRGIRRHALQARAWVSTFNGVLENFQVPNREE